MFLGRFRAEPDSSSAEVPTATSILHPFLPEESSDLLNLIPVAAAIVRFEEEQPAIVAVNRMFRLSGVGTERMRSVLLSELKEELTAFFQSTDAQKRFSWKYGNAVEYRYFDVLLARREQSSERPVCLLTLLDQTAELRTQQNLRREMLTDSLTGLCNRAGFGEVIEERVTNDNRDNFAVLAVNLNGFSRINACMGALSGDELLISVARRLKGALRGRDVLGRTGGDEFAILLHVDDATDDALEVAERIQEVLTTPFSLSDFEIRIDCAIGIALGCDQMADAEDMIRHAQFAVKRAKRTGRTEVYQSRVFDVARKQFRIETELRRAIETRALTLNFQPICDLSTGKITSFESLARWRTEDGTELTPGEFIPVAEESGLIVPLGRWALDEAVRTMSIWNRAADGDCGVKLAVNLSAIQLQRDRVPVVLREALERHGVDGSHIVLELTESALVTDPDGIAHTLRGLKDLGTTLAMDDFGTGYSNLAYLQTLPIDVLKIDRSFIQGMMGDRDKIAIVRAILSLAQALGMQTTAEGIESNELAQTLAALGCTYGQGFLYARPLSADDAFQFLRDS
ncbi:diguanylate cyclase (GGDEF)-like protein [Stakelama sediminis]|uniref:Diguanylate cyclase (GGDEF)-like protein n=1 Tax=Stakelama sediminis TaxID=463200 RepID=A0A840YZA9_9SPHN|nr:bifunctional diguanylate cyclase/phosphodiesterase [Stakelama sediminis]MBB5718983.1 diguanylate cyclase (GGDEF)-like protein [Stakelama sediminis]